MVPGKREEGGEEGKGGRRKGKKDDAEGKEAQTPSFLPSSLHPFPPFFLLLPFLPGTFLEQLTKNIELCPKDRRLLF
jgi:hypothetical protein